VPELETSFSENGSILGDLKFYRGPSTLKCNSEVQNCAGPDLDPNERFVALIMNLVTPL